MPLNKIPRSPEATQDDGALLFNHVVISKILSLNTLSFEDVKNFRLVCTFWHNASIDYWSKKVVIKLLPNTKIRSGISVKDLENRYVSNVDLKRLSNKPYANYQVKGWKPKYDPVNSEVVPAEFSFGAVVAPTVEYLNIEQSNFSKAEKFEEIVLSCLNLQELVLIGNTFMAKNREYEVSIPEEKQLKHLKKLKLDGTMTLGWFQFMLHAPNVESLVFKQNGTYSRQTFSGFLMDHTQLQCRHKFKWPIKHLDLTEATGSYQDLGTLRYHEFPLETVTFQFEKYEVDRWLMPLLQGSAKYLKRMNIIRVSDKIDGPSYKPVDFPCGVELPVLTELYLWGGVVDNLDFLRFTPTLKVVELRRNNFEKRELMTYIGTGKDKPTGSVLKSMEPFEDNVDVVQRTVGCWNNLLKQPVMMTEWLERFVVDCKFGVGSMYTLKRWIPNLKSFGMIFTNNTFLLACEEWPKLEEIHGVYGSIVMDEAVTSRHFLAMKSLKKVHMDAYCNQGWFSDRSVHEGFLKLTPGLTHLQVCVSKQMSEESAKLLYKSIRNVKIIRNYGKETHPGYDCCERMAFNKQRKLLYEKLLTPLA